MLYVDNIFIQANTKYAGASIISIINSKAIYVKLQLFRVPCHFCNSSIILHTCADAVAQLFTARSNVFICNCMARIVHGISTFSCGPWINCVGHLPVSWIGQFHCMRLYMFGVYHVVPNALCNRFMYTSSSHCCARVCMCVGFWIAFILFQQP